MRIFNCNERISRHHPVTIRKPCARTCPGRIFISTPSVRPLLSSFVPLRLQHCDRKKQAERRIGWGILGEVPSLASLHSLRLRFTHRRGIERDCTVDLLTTTVKLTTVKPTTVKPMTTTTRPEKANPPASRIRLRRTGLKGEGNDEAPDRSPCSTDRDTPAGGRIIPPWNADRGIGIGGTSSSTSLGRGTLGRL